MSVWAIAPTAASVSQAKFCFQAWRDQGYAVAVASEDRDALHRLDVDLVCLNDVYPGYAASINRLARKVLDHDPDCQVVVACADDLFPDQRYKAEVIAAAFLEHFDGSLGVMQVTGDRWSSEPDGIPNVERAAMSPWLGRDWCLRSYEGAGPLWAGYHHNFVDNDIQEVATKLGLFWQNPEFRQIHQHWLRMGNQPPAHVQHASAAWDRGQATVPGVAGGRVSRNSALLPE